MKFSTRVLAFSPTPIWSLSWVRPFFLALGLVAAGSQAHALTIISAYDFSDASDAPGSFFTDSSGNGNDLGRAGNFDNVVQSSNHNSAGPSDQSLYFPATHGVAFGAMPGLSTTSALTFDWHMQTVSTRAADNVIFQLGSSNTVSGFLSIRLTANTESTPTVLRISHRLPNSTFDIAEFTLPDPTSWANYTLSIDNSVSGAGRITLWINDMAQTPTIASTGAVEGTFINELRIGAAGSTTAPFTGYLQDFTLYSGSAIPESTTVALLGLAGAVIVFRRPRRK